MNLKIRISENGSGCISCVEQAVSLGFAGCLQIFVVEHLADRAFVRAAHVVLFVRIVEDCGAQTLEVHIVADGVALDGLAAAVDAAAGACHDLDEEIFLLSGSDHINDLAGISEAAGDTDIYFRAVDAVGRFLDALSSADIHEVDLPAGSAEDLTCAGSDSEGIVKLFALEIFEHNTCALDHAGEFSGGDGYIDIRDSLVGQLGSGDLEFLGCAGDHADHVQILGIDVVLLSIVALEESAEHALRGFAGGQVRQHCGIVVLHELDPAGAAGCKHGKRRLVEFLGGDAADELVGLLQDGEVGSDVHVAC